VIEGEFSRFSNGVKAMKNKLGLFCAAALGLVNVAGAATLTQSADPGVVVRGNAGGTVVQFLFAGDGDTQDAQYDSDDQLSR
jgi:hypothetical protein